MNINKKDQQLAVYLARLAGACLAALLVAVLHPPAAHAQIPLVLDDGGMENQIGVNVGGATYQFMWFNRFSPAVASYPFQLDQVSIFWPAEGGAKVGDAIELVVFEDTDGDPTNGATLLGFYNVTVQIAGDWDDYSLTPPIVLSGPGDVLIGAINRFVVSGVTPSNYPAALDETASQGRSWVAWWTGDPPDPPALPPDDVIEVIDNRGSPGNWMIRGRGIPVYTITPTAGVGGSISPATPQTVGYGGSISFFIMPNIGYHIVDVLVDGTSVGAVSAYPFTNVIADHTIIATFALNEYTVTTHVTPLGSGVVLKTPNRPTYYYGDIVIVTAVPTTGWSFAGWSGDADCADGSLRMDANKACTATFTLHIPGVHYVDAGAPGPSHDGLSWTTAYTELQSALAAASAGDEIWVAEGVYYPDYAPAAGDPDCGAYTGLVSATFALTDGVALYGGFAGGESTRSQRDWTVHVTVLSGDIDRNDRTDAHGLVTATAGITGANAWTVVSARGVSGTARLDGFSVSGGNANGTAGDCSLSEPCRSGGGMYNKDSHPSLANVTFLANSADTHGGGMFNDNSSSSLANVTFDANSAGDGGGVYNRDSSPSLANVTFLANSASFEGGGMYNWDSSPSLANVTLYANSASFEGGGMANRYSNPSLANCILWGNSATSGTQLSGQALISYSLVQGGYTGTGNLDANPLFVDAAGANLRLGPGSPTVDAGSNAALPLDTLDLDGDGDTAERLPVDLDGQPRLVGPRVDMGAYEAQPDLAIDKSVASPIVVPGQPVTYSLAFSNTGGVTATGVLITDIVPSVLVGVGWESAPTGPAITRTQAVPGQPITYAWQVQDLAPGASGAITLTGVLEPGLPAGYVLTNTAVITTTMAEGVTANNRSQAVLVAGDANDAPTFTSTPVITATEDMTYTYNVTATDVDAGDVLTLSALTNPAWLSLTDNGDGTGTLSGRPSNGDVGQHAVSLQVEDRAGAMAVQAFTITVSNANDAPMFTSTPLTTAAQSIPYTYTVQAYDPDLVYGDALTITATRLPGWLALLDHGGGSASLAGTPSPADLGQHAVALHVQDTAGLTDTQAFSISVSPSLIATFTLSARPDRLYANGLDEATLTVTATDAAGRGAPFAGRVVTLTWRLPSRVSPAARVLGPGGVASATYTAGLVPGTDTITATVIDPAGPQVAIATLHLQSNPLSGHLDSVFSRDLITYTFVVSNPSSYPQHGVVLTGSVPAGTSLITATGGLSVEQGARVYVVSPAQDLEPGEHVTLRWTVHVPPFLPGTILAEAYASSRTARLGMTAVNRVYRVLLPFLFKNVSVPGAALPSPPQALQMTATGNLFDTVTCLDATPTMDNGRATRIRAWLMPSKDNSSPQVGENHRRDVPAEMFQWNASTILGLTQNERQVDVMNGPRHQLDHHRSRLVVERVRVKRALSQLEVGLVAQQATIVSIGRHVQQHLGRASARYRHRARDDGRAQAPVAACAADGRQGQRVAKFVHQGKGGGRARPAVGHLKAILDHVAGNDIPQTHSLLV
jgi:uncharacterized repeat protein (TIGR01451 family)